MRTSQWLLWAGCIGGFVAGDIAVWGQDAGRPGIPASVIVTIGHTFGHGPGALKRENLTVTKDSAPLTVTGLVPLQGARAGLELFLLVDNCSSCEPGSKFQELRRFITSQAPTTSVGVAYIQDGHLQIAEQPTKDRERAVRALNTPEGSKPASPYVALSELIKNWSPSANRRAILIVSNGVDPAAIEGERDPSAESAIAAAQRSAVTIFAIYHPSADWLKADFSQIYRGQALLGRVAYETGGEAYFLGLGPLPSLAPFLADIAEHLANQYLLTFLANGPAGTFQEISVKSRDENDQLMAPGRVWVDGTAAGPQGRPRTYGLERE